MSLDKRPLAVTILGCIYIAVGAIGFVYHFTSLQASGASLYEGVSIEFIRILAVISGAFMLGGHDWARWLALAWIALHVILSAFQGFPQLAIHFLFCAVIAWILFRPEALRYFR